MVMPPQRRLCIFVITGKYVTLWVISDSLINQWFIFRYGIDENYATLYDLLSSPELSTKAGAVEDKLLIIQKHLTDFTLKIQQLTTFLNGGYY